MASRPITPCEKPRLLPLTPPDQGGGPRPIHCVMVQKKPRLLPFTPPGTRSVRGRMVDSQAYRTVHRRQAAEWVGASQCTYAFSVQDGGTDQ